MKKFIVLIIAIALVLSVAAFSVSAAKPKNFVTDTPWETGAATDVSVKDGICTATLHESHNWSSPYLPLHDAIKDALGDADEIELLITFKVQVVYDAGSDAESTTARVLFRATNGLSVPAEEWADTYAELLGDDSPIFINSDSNVMNYLDGARVEMYPDKWVECRIEVCYTKAQINCEATQNWKLAIDTLSNVKEIDKILFKEVGVYHLDNAPEEEAGVEEEGTEEKEETPTPTPTAKPTATPTKAVMQTPNLGNNAGTDATPVADGSADANNDGGMSTTLIIAIAAGVVIVAGAVVAVVIIAKKKKKSE